MASEKVTALVEEVKGLTVLELSELVHTLEEVFGVSAAAAVGENAEGVQLQPVVIVKAQRRVDPDQGVEDPGMELQPLLGPGMTGVQDRLAVLLCQAIDGAQQGEERLLRVNIFLPVG